MLSTEKQIKIKEQDIPNCLYSMLNGCVFHITPYERFEEIKASGSIQANRDGKLGLNFSKKSFGRHRGWVCLFDFRKELERIAKDSFYKWGFFFHNEDRFGNKLSFLFIDPIYHDKLITWQEAKDEKEYTQLIPYAECWYPGDVSFNMIYNVTHVDIIRKPLTGHVKAVREAWRMIKKQRENNKL